MPVLVPVDVRRPCPEALLLAADLALPREKEIFLVSVEPALAPLSRLAQLHELARPLHEQGVRVHLRTCLDDGVACVHAQAQERRCSWVILSAADPLAPAILRGSPVPAAAVAPAAGGLRLTLRRPSDGELLARALPDQALTALAERPEGLPQVLLQARPAQAAAAG